MLSSVISKWKHQQFKKIVLTHQQTPLYLYLPSVLASEPSLHWGQLQQWDLDSLPAHVSLPASQGVTVKHPGTCHRLAERFLAWSACCQGLDSWLEVAGLDRLWPDRCHWCQRLDKPRLSCISDHLVLQAGLEVRQFPFVSPVYKVTNILNYDLLFKSSKSAGFAPDYQHKLVSESWYNNLNTATLESRFKKRNSIERSPRFIERYSFSQELYNVWKRTSIQRNLVMAKLFCQSESLGLRYIEVPLYNQPFHSQNKTKRWWSSCGTDFLVQEESPCM